MGLLVAIPAVIVVGRLFGRLAARVVLIGASGAGLAVSAGAGGDTDSAAAVAADADQQSRDPVVKGGPSFGLTPFTLLSPLVQMLAKAAADIWLAKGNALRSLLDVIGDPVFALLFAVVLAMFTFGFRVGFSLPT